MKVNLSATLHPGVAALEMSVFCYNRRDGRMPQMFWISARPPGHREDPLHLPDDPHHRAHHLRDRRLAGLQRHRLQLGPQQQAHARRLRHRHLRQLPGRLPVRPRLRRLPLRRPPRRAGHEAVDLRLRRRPPRTWSAATPTTPGPTSKCRAAATSGTATTNGSAPHKVENWSEWWVPVAGHRRAHHHHARRGAEPGSAGRHA